MATQETQTADAQGRVMLPSVFAKATVVMEVVSPTEVHIRKAAASVDETDKLAENSITILSARDRRRFLELMASPPAANAALRKAMARHRKRDG